MAAGSSAYNLVFTYDRYGNMACQLNGSTNGPCPQWSYAPNTSTNQITTSGFSYDPAGNLLANGTGVGTQSFAWDAEERLSTMTNNGGGSVTNVTYNALGQQTQKAFSGYQLQYLYDPWGRHIATYSATQGTWWHQIIRLGDRVLTYTAGSTFLHENNISTSTVTSYASGAFASDQLLFPYGEEWQFNSPGQIYGTYYGNMFGEPDSPNFYKATSRMHDQYHGRWMTPDPLAGDISNPQSLNRYAYALNNPTTNIDPLGLDPSNCTSDVDANGNPIVNCSGPDTVTVNGGAPPKVYSPGWLCAIVHVGCAPILTNPQNGASFGGGGGGSSTAPPKPTPPPAKPPATVKEPPVELPTTTDTRPYCFGVFLGAAANAFLNVSPSASTAVSATQGSAEAGSNMALYLALQARTAADFLRAGSVPKAILATRASTLFTVSEVLGKAVPYLAAVNVIGAEFVGLQAETDSFTAGQCKPTF